MDHQRGWVDDRVFWVVEGLLAEDALFKMADRLVAVWAMLFEQARFVFAHSPGNFLNGFIQSGVHVLTFRLRFDGDVVCTKQDDFRDVAVFLDIKDHFRLNDPWVVEVQALNFFDGVIA